MIQKIYSNPNFDVVATHISKRQIPIARPKLSPPNPNLTDNPIPVRRRFALRWHTHRMGMSYSPLWAIKPVFVMSDADCEEARRRHKA